MEWSPPQSLRLRLRGLSDHRGCGRVHREIYWHTILSQHPGPRGILFVSDFSDPDEPLAFTRPTAARLAAAAQATGLTNRQRVIVYDNSAGIGAAQLWWLLKAFGHEEVSVLDGGLIGWRAEGKPLERGPSAYRFCGQ
jgi:3-mercaptopyruvate sulfurtransferase SseA